MTPTTGRFTPPRLPDDLASLNELARALEIRHDRAEMLALADLAQADLGEPGTFLDHNDRLRITRKALEDYTSRGWVGDHPEAIVVRVIPATPVDEPERSYKGFHGAMTDQEASLALDRWWDIARPEEWVGKHFVAAIAGFVVRAGRVTDFETAHDQVALTIDDTDPETTRTWVGRRFVSPPGRSLIHVTTNQLTTE